MKYVFVYGTLQRGLHNHSVMLRAGGKYVGDGRTVDRYPLLIQGLPYLHKIKGKGHKVKGEIYKVEDQNIEFLDSLEGHPHFYRREYILIKEEGSGKWISCLTYFIANQKILGDIDPSDMHESFKASIKERELA